MSESQIPEKNHWDFSEPVGAQRANPLKDAMFWSQNRFLGFTVCRGAETRKHHEL